MFDGHSEFRRGPWPALTSLQVAQLFKACVKHCARLIQQRDFEGRHRDYRATTDKILKLNRGRIAFVCGRTAEKQLHPLSYLLNRDCILLVTRLASKDDVRILQRGLGQQWNSDAFLLFSSAVLDAYFQAAQRGCKGIVRRLNVRTVQGWHSRFHKHFADYKDKKASD